MQSNESSDLQYIYVTLRKLNYPGRRQLFPRRFLCKLLDERLADLFDLAQELVSELFKNLGNSRDGGATKPQIGTIKTKHPAGSPELEEYFHYCLYYIHDFLIELGWHESNLEDLSGEDSEYVRLRLKSFSAFLKFQSALKSQNTFGRRGVKSIKSSPSGRVSKRRVRFVDSPQPIKDEADLSTFALDLLLFALNMFVQHLCNHLAESETSAADLRSSMNLIRESRTKIRANQVNTISKQIRSANNVFLVVLDQLSAIQRTYLTDHVVRIICARDSERFFRCHKYQQISVYIERLEMDAGGKIVARLADNCLQVLLDLLVSEINFPPVELLAETRTRSREEVVKSRENYFNFLTSWLNLDTTQKRTSTELLRSKISRESNLANDGVHFKSSSRILAQMDNISELIREFLDEIVQRMNNGQQLKYFLELIHLGFDKSFELITSQLIPQLTDIQKKNSKSIAQSVDSIAIKVRCLKLIHLLTSVDSLIIDSAARANIRVEERLLSTKLIEFTEVCTKKSGSQMTDRDGNAEHTRKK